MVFGKIKAIWGTNTMIMTQANMANQKDQIPLNMAFKGHCHINSMVNTAFQQSYWTARLPPNTSPNNYNIHITTGSVIGGEQDRRDWATAHIDMVKVNC